MTDAPPPAGTVDLDLDALVGALTLERKVRLLTGADWWTLPAEPAVGLRAMVLSDGPVGVRGTRRDETDPSANAPAATAVAASWDTDLVAELAGLLAAEARRKGVDVVLGPTVNLHRSPRGGRNFECYSEDPFLTAALGTAYVRALQARGVAATPKHYVANDAETDRTTVDVRVDARTLREVYLRPFEDLVRRGGAWLVMAAYNRVDGTAMTAHPLLTEPLKGGWGFDGVVVSDWFAARDTVATAVAGLDLVMPAPGSPWGEALVAAVRAGAVSERTVDDKVRRLLRLAARVGALAGAPAAVDAGAEPPPGVDAGAEPPQPAVDSAPLLRRAAAAGSVLLTNRGGLLPLSADRLRSVAVLGPHAAHARTQGGGSAQVFPPYVVSPLAGLRAALAGQAEVTHVAGTRLREGLEPLTAAVARHPESGEPGLRVELLAADGSVLRREHRRGGGLRYTSGELPPGTAALRATTRVVVDEPGTWRFGFAGIGELTLAVAGETVFDGGAYPPDLDLVNAFFEQPERAAARSVAAGDTVDLSLTYRVPAGAPATVCTLGCERPPLDREAELARAVAAARAADVAVVVVGTTERVESEGRDRASLALPGDQDALVRAVAAANPRTVVVVCAGAPVELPWRDDVAAVLLTWFGGQELGNAVADVLLGVVEPGGRLPTSWPAVESDAPVLDTTPTGGRLAYAEGLHIGYRAWLRAGRAPAFPFGYGLGYTTWEYETLSVSGTTARVTVRNTGDRPGKEVVQAYLSRPDSAVERPVCWLAGFAPARAAPGEAVTVEVPLDPRGFAYWSVESGRWVTEPGAYRLTVGGHVGDARLVGDVTVDAAGR